MNTINSARRKQRQDGNALLVVFVVCTALLIVSASIFSLLTANRKINHKAQLLAEAREGAEAALAMTTAEVNRRATSYSSFNSTSMTGYSLDASAPSFIVGNVANNNLVSSSFEVKPGGFATSITNLTLNSNDPVYNGDTSKGQTVGVRSGFIYAKASTLDPLTGQLTTAYTSGMVQLREQSWFNYGFFYNMDMEFHPGKQMDILGPVHSNADIYLSANGVSLNLYRMVTAYGHIYHGLEYNVKGYNTDGSVTGFQDNSLWTESNGRGSGSVYITTNGRTALAQMGTTDDCLGAMTNPTANQTNWKALESTGRWNKNIMDTSWGVQAFTPPGMPLYVPEDFSPTNTTTKLRNYAYALIEPPLPTTNNKRYYGRKTVTTGTDSEILENMKFSALAGLTIVVEDLDLAADNSSGNDSYGNPFYNTAARDTRDASANGHAIPWKLVWYKGATNAANPVSMGNYPSRTGGVPEILGTIDPFGLNDEVDVAMGLAINATMQRNLKTLLRDAIVVVPYHDNGGGNYGSGSTVANITGYPVNNAANPNVTFGIDPTGPTTKYYSFLPIKTTATTTTMTRYNQPAGCWPLMNNGLATGGNGYTTYGPGVAKPAAVTSYNLISSATNGYPTNGSTAAKLPNQTLSKYYGMYDRRQGFDITADAVGGLKGASCAVYIDLQKLNWILSHRELWTDPDGNAIYTFDTSYTNVVYVDLPSDAQDATRAALPLSDKVCHAARATATKPGYSVILKNGSRLPRLATYSTNSDSLRTPGFTIATNGPIYIVGNYNADGLDTTGNTFLPDSDASTAASSNTALWYSTAHPDAEIPALVAADAVTFLTDGFRFNQSNQARYGGDAGGGTRHTYNGWGDSPTVTTGSFQEVSTALITGLVPTIPYLYNKQTRWSGGVNNLPRFLEDLTGITYCYRGSMAALYESEVANAPFMEKKIGNWFSPPTRAWGYHQFLASGFFPPATYVVRTARLINVSDISAATYNAGPPTPAN